MSGWINPGQFVTAQSERITTPSNQIRGGYSRLTQALLQAQGIPAMYIGGTANGFSGWPKDGKINHGWSAAFIDGEWIYIDSTWGRSSGTPAVGSEFTLNPSRFDEDALMFSRDHLGKTIFADPPTPSTTQAPPTPPAPTTRPPPGRRAKSGRRYAPDWPRTICRRPAAAISPARNSAG